MNIAMIGIATERLALDVFWFLLLCAILAFFRFHHWRKNRDTRKTVIREAPQKAA